MSTSTSPAAAPAAAPATAPLSAGAARARVRVLSERIAYYERGALKWRQRGGFYASQMVDRYRALIAPLAEQRRTLEAQLNAAAATRAARR
jgi:hypothetical protein